ncbi:AEC family transporter [Opitutaceae bacterium TAV4]|uniref:AEC family transporter n=1 Tax=Geminisphaera colitermitum TaxID=1148786 RepID=UPI000158C7A3|nr:AEC family transporter [Geminisphaera colitermitum]RRJ97749.1 AEC family transporter [Opitutaceae bacterium TAV4]RRK02286.1 AEC family transporter [Opitutaceae bacterium TAV3]
MHAILTSILPIFLIIALGAALQKYGFFRAGVVPALNRLAFFVGLPALIFSGLASAEHSGNEPVRLFLALVLATVLMAGLGWAGAWALRIPGATQGTFVQGVFRGNGAFVGLPVLVALPQVSPTVAMLVIAPLMIVYNVLAVSALLASQHGMGRGVVKALVLGIVQNPIILASVAGGLFYLSGLTCPAPVLGTLRLIAGMVVPVSLICIGSALVTLPLRGNLRLSVLSALGKAWVCPLLGYGVARLLGVEGNDLTVMLVYMAAPTAIMSYTMVQQLGGDEAMAAGTIVLSTLASAVSLGVIVALF